MILGPVSTVDCLAAVVIITPQLLFTAGLLSTLKLIYASIPLFFFILPFHFVRRYVQTPDSRLSFVRNSSVFEDMVIRIVRHAFVNFPIETLRVFLSKQFACPFLRWRMIKSGYFTFPAQIDKEMIREGYMTTTGLWIRHNSEREPDVVVYYVHGGGFALASCYFYLEFLLALHHLLLKNGFKNPAIFALEYTLVPDKVWPSQVNQAFLGYKHVLGAVKDPAKVCVAGDSAGGTLALSLLRELGKRMDGHGHNGTTVLAVPRLLVLISPWITLSSNIHYPSQVDYLERNQLWKYARAYAGSMVNDAAASPGLCQDRDLWKSISPQRGYFVVYGEEETLAPDAEAFVRRQQQDEVEIESMEMKGVVHAWPVASLLLSENRDRRLQGLEAIVRQIRNKSGHDAVQNKDL